MKATDFVTPTGQRGNLLSPSSWWPMIVGVVIFLLTFALGQNLLQRIGSKLPIDTRIEDPLYRAPAAMPSDNRQAFM